MREPRKNLLLVPLILAFSLREKEPIGALHHECRTLLEREQGIELHAVDGGIFDSVISV